MGELKPSRKLSSGQVQAKTGGAHGAQRIRFYPSTLRAEYQFVWQLTAVIGERVKTS